MNIPEFAQDLLKIYEDMSAAFAGYQRSSGLNCLTGCGRCCLNPEVEASVLEMIPLALRIYREGKLEIWLERMETSSHKHCIHYESHSDDGLKGKCGVYAERPSLCRMFGVSGFFDKNHQVTLSICKLIKEDQPMLAIQRTKEASEEKTPMMSTWSYRLSNLDPALIQNKLPINEAFKGALEKIALYAQYQDLT